MFLCFSFLVFFIYHNSLRRRLFEFMKVKIENKRNLKKLICYFYLFNRLTGLKTTELPITPRSQQKH